MTRNILTLGLCLSGWTMAKAADAAPFDRPSAGDIPGEVQPPPHGYPIPPAPVLSPAEALKTFKLAPGFRIELVASEPLVDTPVALDFDPDGRIWVVEMRGYQTDPEGAKRLEPNGRIVVLEDTDGDGRMDKSTVYMDNLVLPRAVKVLSDGVLVAEPPYVWFTKFRRGSDGKFTIVEKTPIVEDYGVRDSNPDNEPNGLFWGIDNWIHNANYSGRFRRADGKWEKVAMPVYGHFGMGIDDYGRDYLGPNTAPFHANLVDGHYGVRNPNHNGGGGIYEAICSNQERFVFPIRVNPGVNRGYTSGTLRADGRLAKYTAGCGTTIFRGDRLGADVYGNHFFCEPAGNLVRRTVLKELPDGRISGTNAYKESEFLASTDERFRPVNAHTAPDGTLYIVDMARGLIESHSFVTTYLKRQVYERGLLEPLHRGRIYRIRHESIAPGPAPHLSQMTSAQLVALLSHPNGWWRDNAQRLIVERADKSVAPELRKILAGDQPEVPRLHALWTLEGLGVLSPSDVQRELVDRGPHLRSAAVRISEQWFGRDKNSELVQVVLRTIDDSDASVRLQASVTLGELKTPEAESALAALVTHHASQPYLTDAVISGLASRELEFLEDLTKQPAWASSAEGYDDAIAQLARTIFREGKPKRVAQLLAWTAAPERPAWQKLAVLQSVTKPVHLDAKIKVPDALANSDDARIKSAAAKLTKHLEAGDGRSRPLTDAETKLFTIGAKNYGTYCAQCHQAEGQGLPDNAPTLVGSKWALAPAHIPVKLVLMGKQDKTLLMPPWGTALNDETIASILTYVRNSWGNHGSAVAPEMVKKARVELQGMKTFWTEETLAKEAGLPKG